MAWQHAVAALLHWACKFYSLSSEEFCNCWAGNMLISAIPLAIRKHKVVGRHMAWRLSKVTAKYETQKYYISFLYQNFMYSITDQQRTILWTSNQRYQHTKEKCNVNLITTLVTRNSQQMYTCQHKIIAIVYDDLFCGTSARWCFGGILKGTFLSTGLESLEGLL
jgi:hypothetical protein